MRPLVAKVGPLVSATATKVSLAQSPGAAGALALNGAAGSFVANNVCLSQTTAGATALLINGALNSTRLNTSNKIAILPGSAPQAIYITSAGNDSGITFAVVGLDINNSSQTETLQGTNTSVVATTKLYKTIISVTPSGATSGSGVTVGTNGVATLDTPRRILFTSSGDDTNKTITISGTNWAGFSQSETLAGGNPTASTVLDYATVTQAKVSAATAGTISVGTNGVAASPWLMLDPYAHGQVSCQAVVSGTANYTVQVTNDDPNSPTNPVAAASVTWDSAYSGVTGATASSQFGLPTPPQWMRTLLNSGSGSITLTVIQAGAVPQ